MRNRRLLRVLGLFFIVALCAGQHAGAASNYSRQNYTPVGGVATNATWTGPWIPVRANGAIAFQVVLTGTSAPVATWGADVTDDDNPNASGGIGATALTLTSEMTAQNPIGDSANINFLFMFDPSPPARWMRFKYTRSSGGSATKLLFIGVAATKGSQ